MAGPLLFDRVYASVTGNPGTSTVTCGSAVAGYQAMSVVGDGNTADVLIQSVDANGVPTGLWEHQLNSTYTASGTTLSRSAANVFDGSSGPGVLVNFSSGTQKVGILPGADIAGQIKGGNHLANGGMWLAQRQVPGTLTNVATDTYGADRWRASRETASLHHNQTDTNGSQESGISARYYSNWKQITAAGKFLICQPMEGSSTYDLAGKMVTFQVKMKASSSKTIRLGVCQLNSSGTMDAIPATLVTAYGSNSTDPTMATNVARITPSYVPGGANGTISGAAVSCSVTTTWQLFACTVIVPATAKNLIPCIWTDSQFSANDILSITEAGLYPGQAWRDWFPLPLQQEIAKCQRFCYVLRNTSGGDLSTGGVGFYVSTTVAALQIPLPVTPRTKTPTISLSNPTVDFTLFVPGVGSVAVSSAAENLSVGALEVDITTASQTAGTAVSLTAANGATITVDAEL